MAPNWGDMFDDRIYPHLLDYAQQSHELHRQHDANLIDEELMSDLLYDLSYAFLEEVKQQVDQVQKELGMTP